MVDGLAEDAEAAVALVPHHGAPVAADRDVAAVPDLGEVRDVARRPAAHCERKERLEHENEDKRARLNCQFPGLVNFLPAVACHLCLGMAI